MQTQEFLIKKNRNKEILNKFFSGVTDIELLAEYKISRKTLIEILGYQCKKRGIEIPRSPRQPKPKKMAVKAIKIIPYVKEMIYFDRDKNLHHIYTSLKGKK